MIYLFSDIHDRISTFWREHVKYGTTLALSQIQISHKYTASFDTCAANWRKAVPNAICPNSLNDFTLQNSVTSYGYIGVIGNKSNRLFIDHKKLG